MKSCAVVVVAVLSVGAFAVASTVTMKVNSVSPRQGGISGSVLLTIGGTGFSKDKFSYGEGNENKGNTVQLVNGGHSVACDIHPNGCTTVQLQCYTRAGMALNTAYKVSVKVDGTLVTSICDGCTFTPVNWYTPRLSSITPRSGKTSETVLTLYGRIYTGCYGGNMQCTNGVTSKLLRVYTPNQCNLYSKTDTFYQFQLNDATSKDGTIQCLPETRFVGNVIPYILVEPPYGGSSTDLSQIYTSRTGKPYSHQRYTDIQEFYPAVGSTEGGLELTVRGDYYDTNSKTSTYAEAKVYVGNSECDITHVEPDEYIKCQVSEKTDDEWFPGNRGVLVETFDISFDTYENVVAYDGDSVDIHWYDETSYSEPKDKWTRMRSVIVSPSAGAWQFAIKAKNKASLFIDDDSGIESTGAWTYTQKKTLDAGQKVQMIAVGQPGSNDDSRVDILAINWDTTTSPQISGHSIAEKQRVTFTSTVKYENFTLTFNNFDSQSDAVYTEQEITLTSNNDEMRLRLYGAETTTVHLNDLDEVKKALNKLPFKESDESFTVSKKNTNTDATTIVVRFESVRGKISIIEPEPSSRATVTEVTTGKSNNRDISFELDNVLSPLITYTAASTEFADRIKDAIEKMFSVQCPTAFTTGSTYQGYEEGPSSFSAATAEMPAFCGRYSCKNCNTLFPISNVDKLPLQAYPWMCFAIKGLENDDIRLRFKYGNDVEKVGWFGMGEGNSDGDWTYICMNIKEEFKERWPTEDRSFSLVEAYIRNVDSTVDFYVDELQFGMTSPLANIPDEDFIGLRMEPDKTLKWVTVTPGDSDEYFVSLAPFECEHSFKLLTLAGSSVGSVNSASATTVTSTLFGRTGNMVTTRTQKASKPIEGKVQLTYNDTTSNEIEVMGSTAAKFQENLAFMGPITVTKTDESSCSHMDYVVEFSGSGGSKQLMTVSDTLTSPTGASATTARDVEGREMLEPIAGDIAYTWHKHPQVRVFINDIPTKCVMTNYQCTFTWSEDATPTITATDITEGNKNDVLTINGTKFSTEQANNTVTIGGVPCDVTFSSEDQIKCTVGYGSLDTFPVIVTVDGKGKASGNFEFTYTARFTTLTPSQSTLAAHDTATITGEGFSDATVVKFGSEICDITNKVLPTTIYCTIPSYSNLGVDSDQTVEVSVTIGTVPLSPTKQFTYKYIEAQITEVIVDSELKVHGGQNITIEGTNMCTGDEVRIGNTELTVHSRSATEIIAETPQPMTPGDLQYLLVFCQDTGAVLKGSEIPPVNVSLKLTYVSPSSGSLNGGTPMTIEGKGFGNNQSVVEVFVGDYKCEIEELTDTVIKCDIERTAETHLVTNNGGDDAGLSFAFSESEITVMQGDYVRWTWTTPEDFKDITQGISEIETFDADEDKVGGITSGDKTREGTFVHRFVEAERRYYFRNFIPSISESYRMVVNVVTRPPTRVPISVAVVGKDTRHDVDSGGSTLTDSSSCDFASSNIGDCSPESISALDSKFSFLFTKCKSPVVDEITLVPADSSVAMSVLATTQLTLNGAGFSTSDCANEATIGGCDCDVVESETTSFKCTPKADCEYDTGVYQKLELRVIKYGWALIKKEKRIDRSFVFLPMVTLVSPLTGSDVGGTPLTISGTAFTDDPSKLQVTIGVYDAVCSQVDKLELICSTPSVSTAGSLPVPVSVKISGVTARCKDGIPCTFKYDSSVTPSFTSVTPTSVSSQTDLQFTGINLGNNASKLSITVGGEICHTIEIITANTVVSCTVDALPAGNNTVNIALEGIGDGSTDVIVEGIPVVSVSPSSGSKYGCTELILSGHGFVDGMAIQVDNVNICETINVTSLTQATCLTKPHEPESVNLKVESNGVTYDDVSFDFSDEDTPTITTINPNSGAVGITLTISGNNFSPELANNKVSIGGSECTNVNWLEGKLTCTTGAQSSGSYDTVVNVVGKGKSNPSTFVYEVTVTSFSPSSGSTCGNQWLTVTGNGFTDAMVVKVCDEVCQFHSITSSTEIVCVTPAKQDAGSCQVTVTEGNASPVAAPTDYVYQTGTAVSVTDITPSRGGTGGNTQVVITGTGFSETMSEVSVTIDGVACDVTSSTSTEIVCRTGAHVGTKLSEVVVSTNDIRACAATGVLEYNYADAWSSSLTWGGLAPPVRGDLVVIRAGQTILLDEDTEVLELLLIQGELIFDEIDLTLRAKHILIAGGGKLQIGTEKNPFQSKAIIELHGHFREPGLPLFGTKVVAVREGEFNAYGRVIENTWTVLAETAEAGATSILVEGSVSGDWKSGDEIVIATTGDRNSFGQNEKRKIVDVAGKNITLDEALEFEHLGVEKTLSNGIETRTVNKKAEVGLLTRNVVVRGSRDADWNIKIDACPGGFNPGEFATQTCFQGRAGDETGSDQFGGHIMMHKSDSVEGQAAKARLSYVEITHMGQAFQLGRYPVHFHLNGDMSESFVRGSAIHETFNRAINIHGVHNTVIEKNVIFNVMGGALFLEDGIETNNKFLYNLAVYVRQSTSLLNDDVTPAAYWITNSNNTYLHNNAAGGTHFGFWFRMHEHPDGPSYDPDICPRRVPIQEFRNNTAHSQGWFGLWIFQEYHPAKNSLCNAADGPAISVIEGFTTWNCEKGIEMVTVGGAQVHDMTSFDHEKASFEGKLGGDTIRRSEFSEMVSDSFVGYTSEDASQGNDKIIPAGIIWPFADTFQMHNVSFFNFNNKSVAIKGTSVDGTCSDECVTGSIQSSGLIFINVTNNLFLRWSHEVIIEDMDGSIFNTNRPVKVVPKWGDGWPESCNETSDYLMTTDTSVPALLCDFGEKFHVLGFNDVKPSSLDAKVVVAHNPYGNTTGFWRDHRVKFKKGWRLNIVSNVTTTISFLNAGDFTNTSFLGMIFDMDPGACVIIRMKVQERPDLVTGDDAIPSKEESEEFDCGTLDLAYGDWFYKDRHVNFAVVNGGDKNTDMTLNLRVLKCYYENCTSPPDPNEIPPPESRPDYILWNDTTKWSANTTTNLMTASKTNNATSNLPSEGQDVLVEKETWLLIREYDVPKLGTVTIKGVVEIDYEYEYDYVFQAENIVIIGGRFYVGWLDNPMTVATAQIILTADRNRQMVTGIAGPPIGNGAIAVFGALELNGRDIGKPWVRLAETAFRGDDSITVSDETDAANWEPGNKLILTTTSTNTAETEEVTIKSINGKTITLEEYLRYRHSGGLVQVNGKDIDLSAAVGVRTRSVVVKSEVVPGDAYGGRILVGVAVDDGNTFNGYARLNNVQVTGMGQDGFTESDDPRFAIAYLGTGSVSDNKPSTIKNSVIENSFNTAFGAFGMDDFIFENNIVYKALGTGLITTSTNTTFHRNLIVSNQWTGSFDGRNEDFNMKYEPALDGMESTDLILRHNMIVGSERIGFRVPGEDCNSVENRFIDNYAAANLMGVAILPGDTSVHDKLCIKLSNFLFSKNVDYGLYYHTRPSLEAPHNVYSDENSATFLMVIGPDPLEHTLGNDKIELTDSIFIGTSSVTDCSEETLPSGPYIDLSSDQRSSRGPNGERQAGAQIGVFTSGSNGCPFKPCRKTMSYNAILGLMEIYDVTFVNFTGEQSGCKEAVALFTLKDNDDANHPVWLRNITLINVEEEYKFGIHRPNLGRINPSDCVDMDCDGLKKVLVRDLDGSFFGSPASAIPQSEWQWDGDSRRGLGDYRIPKAALTNLDGSRRDIDEIGEFKGIVRTPACESRSISDGRSGYHLCLGLPYQMFLIESLDDDTETRRLSPIAVFYDDEYVDLLNGPQDHGWCNGYTCQKRISTFLTIVLPGTSVDRLVTIYYSSTPPKRSRFAMVYAEEETCVIVAVFYPNPNRVDVLSGDTYKLPLDAVGDENGNFLKYNTQKDVNYIPTCADDDHASNYLDRDARLIYFAVKGGSQTVILQLSTAVVVSFGFPVQEADFFDEDNLIQNLAALLNVPVRKIRVVKIIAASSTRRRRSTGGTTVVVELGDPPPSATTPESTESTDPDEPVTQYAEVLMDTCQEGTMGSILETETICEEIIIGEKTYTPAQPEELVFIETIVPQHEGVAFTVQPKIRAYDTNGDVIEDLGIEESPWEITASLRSCDSSCGHTSAVLSGTLTIPSSGGWFNFTDLKISHKGENYIIDFEITSPTGTNLTLESAAFSVDGLPMSAGLISMTSGNILQNSILSWTLDLRDNFTDIAIPDITWRNHTFDVTCGPVTAPMTGNLTGTLSTTFDSISGRASFVDLSFSGYGVITIGCLIASSPPEYEFYSFHDVFVLHTDQVDINAEALDTIEVRFMEDYDTVLPTKAAAEQLKQATGEMFTMMYQYILIRQISIGKGSIIVTFTIEGTSGNVTAVLQDICKELSSGMQVTIGGNSLTLDNYLTVDGTDYYSTCTTKEESDGGLHPAIIALIVILCLLVIGIVVFVLVWRFKIRPKSRTHDMKGEETNNTNRGGFYYIDNGRTVFLGAHGQKVQDILYKKKTDDNELQANSAAPITTLYDETPGYFHIRRSPLPPKLEDGARSLTPTGN